MFVCRSVSWLNSLLKLGQYRDIYCLGWDIFLKFFEIFQGCFNIISQQFQISMFVCQSFIWLTSILRLGQYRYISWKSYLSESFWRHSWDIFSLHLCPLGKFDMEHPWTQASEIRKNQLGRSCGAHVWAVKGPSFDISIISLLLLQMFQNCTKIPWEINRMLNYWSYVKAMLGPYLGHFGQFWTMFGLAFLSDQLELWNFQDLVNMVIVTFL